MAIEFTIYITNFKTRKILGLIFNHNFRLYNFDFINNKKKL